MKEEIFVSEGSVKDRLSKWGSAAAGASNAGSGTKGTKPAEPKPAVAPTTTSSYKGRTLRGLSDGPGGVGGTSPHRPDRWAKTPAPTPASAPRDLPASSLTASSHKKRSMTSPFLGGATTTATTATTTATATTTSISSITSSVSHFSTPGLGNNSSHHRRFTHVGNTGRGGGGAGAGAVPPPPTSGRSTKTSPPPPPPPKNTAGGSHNDVYVSEGSVRDRMRAWGKGVPTFHSGAGGATSTAATAATAAAPGEGGRPLDHGHRHRHSDDDDEEEDATTVLSSSSSAGGDNHHRRATLVSQQRKAPVATPGPTVASASASAAPEGAASSSARAVASTGTTTPSSGNDDDDSRPALVKATSISHKSAPPAYASTTLKKVTPPIEDRHKLMRSAAAAVAAHAEDDDVGDGTTTSMLLPPVSLRRVVPPIEGKYRNNGDSLIGPFAATPAPSPMVTVNLKRVGPPREDKWKDGVAATVPSGGNGDDDVAEATRTTPLYASTPLRKVAPPKEDKWKEAKATSVHSQDGGDNDRFSGDDGEAPVAPLYALTPLKSVQPPREDKWKEPSSILSSTHEGATILVAAAAKLRPVSTAQANDETLTVDDPPMVGHEEVEHEDVVGTDPAIGISNHKDGHAPTVPPPPPPPVTVPDAATQARDETLVVEDPPMVEHEEVVGTDPAIGEINHVDGPAPTVAPPPPPPITVPDADEPELSMEDLVGSWAMPPSPLEAALMGGPGGGGNKKLLILISTMSGRQDQKTAQSRAMTILKGLNIGSDKYEELDGADPANKARRNELFEISGLRGKYPQFFLVDSSATTEFMGDWEFFESMHDSGNLEASMSLRTDVGALKEGAKTATTTTTGMSDNDATATVETDSKGANNTPDQTPSSDGRDETLICEGDTESRLFPSSTTQVRLTEVVAEEEAAAEGGNEDSVQLTTSVDGGEAVFHYNPSVGSEQPEAQLPPVQLDAVEETEQVSVAVLDEDEATVDIPTHMPETVPPAGLREECDQETEEQNVDLPQDQNIVEVETEPIEMSQQAIEDEDGAEVLPVGLVAGTVESTEADKEDAFDLPAGVVSESCEEANESPFDTPVLSANEEKNIAEVPANLSTFVSEEYHQQAEVPPELAFVEVESKHEAPGDHQPQELPKTLDTNNEEEELLPSERPFGKSYQESQEERDVDMLSPNDQSGESDTLISGGNEQFEEDEPTELPGVTAEALTAELSLDGNVDVQRQSQDDRFTHSNIPESSAQPVSPIDGSGEDQVAGLIPTIEENQGAENEVFDLHDETIGGHEEDQHDPGNINTDILIRAEEIEVAEEIATHAALESDAMKLLPLPEEAIQESYSTETSQICGNEGNAIDIDERNSIDTPGPTAATAQDVRLESLESRKREGEQDDDNVLPKLHLLEDSHADDDGSGLGTSCETVLSASIEGESVRELPEAADKTLDGQTGKERHDLEKEGATVVSGDGEGAWKELEREPTSTEIAISEDDSGDVDVLSILASSSGHLQDAGSEVDDAETQKPSEAQSEGPICDDAPVDELISDATERAFIEDSACLGDGYVDDVGAVDNVEELTGGACDDVEESTGDVGELTGGAVDDVEESTGDVEEVTGGACDDVEEITGGACDDVEESAGGAVDDVVEITGGAVDDVVEITGGAVDNVEELMGGTVDDVVEITGGACDDVVEIRGSTCDDVEETTAVSSSEAAPEETFPTTQQPETSSDSTLGGDIKIQDVSAVVDFETASLRENESSPDGSEASAVGADDVAKCSERPSDRVQLDSIDPVESEDAPPAKSLDHGAESEIDSTQTSGQATGDTVPPERDADEKNPETGDPSFGERDELPPLVSPSS